MLLREIRRLLRRDTRSRIFIRSGSGCGSSKSEIVVTTATTPQIIQQGSTVPVQPQIPVVLTCPNCKNPVPPDANFCPMCGFKLSDY